MRVLTDRAETGAVSLASPQDVRAGAYDRPDEPFDGRVWHLPRRLPEPAAPARPVAAIRSAERPPIVAGGDVTCAGARRARVEVTGIPVAETGAGPGALPYDHPLAVGMVPGAREVRSAVPRPQRTRRYLGGCGLGRPRRGSPR
jgi:3D-(3,5/4)-trihydroxycyclohexane-1,2-dione acylhydrolase (decyclizing)